MHEKVLIRADFKGKIQESKNFQFKYIPKNYLSPVTTIVFGNKVAHLIFSPPYHTILTTNKDLADSFKSHFNFLWKIAKK